MTLDALVPLLRCPACAGALAFEAVRQRDAAAGTCGVLTCGCAAYPVLDEVPILRRGPLAHRAITDHEVVAEGDEADDVVRQIRDGRGLDALVGCLTTPFCPWPLNRFNITLRLSKRGATRRAGLRFRRRGTRRRLAARDRLTAEDWMAAFYWHGAVPYDPFCYFFFRFGQPRHLATLGLASILPPDDRPVLDLACGYGHVLHSLTAAGHAAVGVEQNVHQAWLARHYVAPGAAFVCADANAPLPFRPASAGAALCSDAFHYFEDKAATLAELRRVADGPLLLATVGNANVAPHESAEWDPEGYAALFGDAPWRVRTEAELLARYLDGRGPDLSASSARGAVEGEKWLYYVVDGGPLFREHGPFPSWPHLAGTVAVNPLYEAQGGRLTFRFPSAWYRFENGAMRDYMPASVDRAAADDDEWAARAVRVGLPERYARPAGRPRTLAANRALDALLSLRP